MGNLVGWERTHEYSQPHQDAILGPQHVAGERPYHQGKEKGPRNVS